jgi:hypothetical protein
MENPMPHKPFIEKEKKKLELICEFALPMM